MYMPPIPQELARFFGLPFPPPLTEEERKGVAHHEAGHAVVANHLGYGIVEASIDPERLNYGENGRVKYDRDMSGLTGAVMCLAGCVAEGKYTHKNAKELLVGQSDLSTAAYLVNGALGPDTHYKYHNAMMTAYWQAETYVEQFWDKILLVAAKLLDKGTLTGNEIVLTIKIDNPVDSVKVSVK